MEKLHTVVYDQVHVYVIYVHVNKTASSKQGHYNLKMKRLKLFSHAPPYCFFVLFHFIFIRIC